MYNSTKQNNNYAGPRFNSSNQIPFFALSISFCQANGCGTPLKTSSGKVADTKPLNDTEHAELAEMGTPSRASVAATMRARTPRAKKKKSDPPVPDELDDKEYGRHCRDLREQKSHSKKYVDQCAKIAGFLRQAVSRDAIGSEVVSTSIGVTGDDGPGALLALYENDATGPSGHSLLHNLDFSAFRQAKLSMNDFLAKLNQFFKTKEMCLV